MSKGEQTRSTILHHALDLASEVGLEAVTFGVLAKRTGLSKSGLYAHFDSKESLQCAVLDSAAARFVDVVVSPALKQPRGIPRLERLFELWLKWGNDELTGGCPLAAAATDFDDRPGPVRDHLVGHIKDLLEMVSRAARIAVDEGHFAADLDTTQFAYEFWGALLAQQHFRRLLADPQADARAERAFRRLLDRSRPLQRN